MKLIYALLDIKLFRQNLLAPTYVIVISLIAKSYSSSERFCTSLLVVKPALAFLTNLVKLNLFYNMLLLCD